MATQIGSGWRGLFVVEAWRGSPGCGSLQRTMDPVGMLDRGPHLRRGLWRTRSWLAAARDARRGCNVSMSLTHVGQFVLNVKSLYSTVHHRSFRLSDRCIRELIGSAHLINLLSGTKRQTWGDPGAQSSESPGDRPTDDAAIAVAAGLAPLVERLADVMGQWPVRQAGRVCLERPPSSSV